MNLDLFFSHHLEHFVSWVIELFLEVSYSAVGYELPDSILFCVQFPGDYLVLLFFVECSEHVYIQGDSLLEGKPFEI